MADISTELELISSSLLPCEALNQNEGDSYTIISTDSLLSIAFELGPEYPARDSVKLEIKGEIGREEGEGWRIWIGETMESWVEDSEYPLYEILTTHFLPLLARNLEQHINPSETTIIDKPLEMDTTPHHALLMSHHLLAPSKRRDLLSLSRSLRLTGFCKIGYPGIMYAVGTRDNIQEWVEEVKRWQWLALRVKIATEICDPVKSGQMGASGFVVEEGKDRGDWTEVEKVSEGLVWMQDHGREEVLLNLGVGARTAK